jgi:hypothetical protein
MDNVQNCDSYINIPSSQTITWSASTHIAKKKEKQYPVRAGLHHFTFVQQWMCTVHELRPSSLPYFIKVIMQFV